MKTQSISFKGVFDIRYPKNVTEKKIEEDRKALSKGFNEYCPFEESYDILSADIFEKTPELSEKGIRVVTTFDNPYLLVEIFKKVDEKLAKQYIENTKVELINYNA